MSFEGESLTIRGRNYVGAVFIETEISNASFNHEHGREHVVEIRHYPECFVADGVSGCMAKSIDAEAMPALDAWLTSNLHRVEKAFDALVKRS